MLEVEDVPQVRAAPLVDRLVGIPHHGEVPVSRGQPLNQQVLRAVGVLVLVHHDVAELLRVLLPDALRLLDELHGVQQQVVEVERPGVLERLGVHRVQLAEVLVARIPGALENLRPLHAVLRVTDPRQHHPGLRGRVVDAQLLEALLDDRELVVRVVDDEVPRESDVRRLAPEQPRAQGVERRDPHLPAVHVEQLLDTRPHLLGGLVGERDGKDRRRVGVALADEVGDAVRDDARLAGAGARQDQDGAVRLQNRLLLFRVEAGNEIHVAGRPVEAGPLPILP